MLSCHEQGIRSALSTTEKVIILPALVRTTIAAAFASHCMNSNKLRWGSTGYNTIWEMDLSSVEQKAICG